MKISIIGLGYVGLSLSVLLSQKYKVVSTDIDKKKINKIKKKIVPFFDDEIEKFFKSKKLDLKVTADFKQSVKDSNYTIIAVPTDYNRKSNKFNTSIVENVIRKTVRDEPKTTLIIKSTVPYGFTDNVKKKFKINDIFYSPEFLRESKALYDNLFPTRIVIGEKNDKAKKFAEMLKRCAIAKRINVYFMSSKEAEATKLFANTYLAMRVSFFNELDTFSETNNLNTKKIIESVSSDPRVGNYYNNPSFGYGGYCLPKDTKQLLENYKKIPNNIISGVVKANRTRKKHIANSIIKTKPSVVGVYRLIMKSESDNFRESAILDIIDILKEKGINIIVYEPLLSEVTNKKFKILNKLDKFLEASEIIIANRVSSEIKHVKEKVYTRDIFEVN